MWEVLRSSLWFSWLFTACAAAHKGVTRWNSTISTMTRSSSSSSGSESEGHQKKSKKDKKAKKEKKDKQKDKGKGKDKDKDKNKHNKLKHGESSGLNALGVIQDVHKLGDHKHDGSRAGHVPAVDVNLQHPHVLDPTHNTILPIHNHEYSSTHGASLIHGSGLSIPSVSQSSGSSPSGHRVPIQAGDRLPSLHETGPAPFLDADGGPVFIGSALFERSVHPCKIAPNVRDSEAPDITLRSLTHNNNNNAATPTLPRTLRR